jgi:hypothetical protein
MRGLSTERDGGGGREGGREEGRREEWDKVTTIYPLFVTIIPGAVE